MQPVLTVAMPPKRFAYGLSFVSKGEVARLLGDSPDETTINDVWQSYLNDVEIPKIVKNGETLVGIRKLVRIEWDCWVSLLVKFLHVEYGT